MIKGRQRRVGVVCALAFACLCVPAANAGQTASTDGAPAKPANSSVTHKSSATHSSSAATKKPAGTSHTSTTHSASTKTASNAKHSSRRKKTVRARGQQKIDSERATTIQAALIREHYLSGDPTGNWNEASEEAMRRYQGDHGWQTKEVPDARALIRLGLGPDNAHLLNPESAMTSAPVTPQSSSPVPTSQTSAPVASPAAQTPAQSDSPQRR